MRTKGNTKGMMTLRMSEMNLDHYSRLGKERGEENGFPTSGDVFSTIPPNASLSMQPIDFTSPMYPLF